MASFVFLWPDSWSLVSSQVIRILKSRHMSSVSPAVKQHLVSPKHLSISHPRGKARRLKQGSLTIRLLSSSGGQFTKLPRHASCICPCLQSRLKCTDGTWRDKRRWEAIPMFSLGSCSVADSKWWITGWRDHYSDNTEEMARSDLLTGSIPRPNPSSLYANGPQGVFPAICQSLYD